ncbi:N/A [soil metagenome]
MSHFVFVESNTTGTGRLAVELLVDEGADVTFVTQKRDRYPFLATERPGLHVVACDTNDSAVLEARLREIARARPIDALLTFSTFYVTAVAEVARRLGLPGLDPEAANLCHQKHLGRQRFRRDGLPTPDFWVVSTEAEVEEVARTVTYPCVVKPVAESGSAGVRLIESPEALRAHYRTLAGRTINERGQPLFGEVLIETLLTGPELSVETLTFGGTTRVIGITQKRLSEPPWFVELGHVFPAELDEGARTSVERAVRAGLVAVGLDFGPAHTELRMTEEGPVIVEINPRLAGGMIPELVRWATGIDLLRAVLALALGESPAAQATRDEVAGIRFFTARRPGILRDARGLDDVRKLATVRDVRIDKPTGASVRAAECATDRLGYVIAAGPDREAVVRDLDSALALVELVID